ncbi:dioxygenase [Microbacterium sp.]|uniref:dioxygenase n=1 Tax=Microbacterium sp. TaxID=51671 RepID=UPI003A8523F0
MAKAVGKKDARAARERNRVYHARQEFHRGVIARRRRDNVVAGVAGGVLLVAIIGGQTLYFTAGPGAPTPSPTPTATETPVLQVPSATPVPEETATPEPSSTP